MTTPDLSPQAQSLVARVKNILMKPKEEWAVIDVEQTSIQKLFVGYILILAAIGPIASMIGGLVFGYSAGWGAFAVSWRPSVGGAISGAVVSYVLSLIGVVVLALVIEFLAPQFGGQKDRVQAFKVAAYSMTAAWVAGIFGIVPALAGLAVLGGLYGIYLLWLGLPRLMRVPEDKALVYFIVVIVVALVVNAVAMTVAGSVMAMGRVGGLAANGAATGTIGVPGYGSVNVEKAEAASTAANAAIASALAQGAETSARPVGIEALSGVLPASVGGFSRGEVSQVSSSAGGLNTAAARATYTGSEGSIELSVTDMGGAAAFAQLASAFDVNRTEREGDSYERMAKVGGRLTIEKYDAASRSGEYSVVVAERFMVEARGRNVDMAALKSAVNSVGFARLEALAR